MNRRDSRYRKPSRQDQAIPPYRSRRGSIILFVLGLVLLTSLLLTQFISRAHTELLTEARRSQIEPLRNEAYSALQVSLAVLNDLAAVDEGLHGPAQGWGEPLVYADYIPPPGFTVEAAILDESGKLPLGTRDATVLQNLLRELQVPIADADRFVEALLAWTESEAIARSLDGSINAIDGAPALTAPQAALRSFDELRFIPATRAVLCDEQGDWNETGRAFLVNVTLHPLSTINVNSASEVVLNALGLDAGAIEARRTTSKNPRDSVLRSLGDIRAPAVEAANGIQTGVEATVLRIRIITAYGARKFTLDAVVQPGGPSPTANPSPAEAAETEPRPWTRNSIDSGFRILEIQENNGY